jgi:hypothetical protein
MTMIARRTSNPHPSKGLLEETRSSYTAQISLRPLNLNGFTEKLEALLTETELQTMHK